MVQEKSSDVDVKVHLYSNFIIYYYKSQIFSAYLYPLLLDISMGKYYYIDQKYPSRKFQNRISDQTLFPSTDMFNATNFPSHLGETCAMLIAVL